MAKKPLSFKDFMVVDYTPGMPDQVSYNAMKRRRGRHDTSGPIGESTEELDEALSPAERRKKSIRFKRLAPRIKIAKEKALRRTATLDKLKQRARKAARKMMFNKLSKNTDKDSIPFARRQEIEKRLDKMKPRIDRLALKLLPKQREIERERKRPKDEKEQGK